MKKKKKKKNKEKSYIDYFYHEPATVPGTLKISDGACKPKVMLIDYNQKEVESFELKRPDDCISYIEKESVSWFDIQGLGDEEILKKIGEIFKLHPLVLEDVVNVPQRPKFEDYESQILLILQMVYVKNVEELDFSTEQVSFILGEKYLLTFQEEEKYDTFDGVRDRIKHSKGNIRKRGSGYLIYTLIDSVIDGFYPVLEVFGEEIERLEEEAVENPTRATLKKIYYLKRKLLELKRLIWPVRDAIQALMREESPLIGKDVDMYLKDCYDHSVQVLDVVENYRDLTYSLMDVYMSSVGNKMNDIMKVLTIIATIFIPLTFVAGVYGMNFNPGSSPLNMPELNWYWGYPAVWILMIAIGAVLFYVFWRKGWFKGFSDI